MKLNEHQQNALRSWDALNAYVRTVNDEAVCLALVDAELAMPNPRGVFLLRIHARYNRIRAAHERSELMAKANKSPLKNGERI
jgi:hypothetical protein